MFLAEELVETISLVLAKKTGAQQSLRVISAVAGGSINSCYRLQYGGADYFLKVNSAAEYPRMFMAEAEGLKLIKKAGIIRVPEVIGFGQSRQEQFLLLEWIEKGQDSVLSQELLGQQLALLHRTHSGSFGLDHSNYMGSLIQVNDPAATWEEFFVKQRLEPQVKLARDNKFIGARHVADFDMLYLRISELALAERPSLIHGDLWSGNCMIASDSNPVLIDPAASFGNREFDVAMTTLFGGFHSDFYRAYHNAYPLQPGWKERLDLWNIYPLLIHLNIFGASYLPRVEANLSKYL